MPQAISNEWGMSRDGTDGYEAITYDIWRETYKTAVTTLREAGIKNLLVIDSFNYATSAEEATVFEGDVPELPTEVNDPDPNWDGGGMLATREQFDNNHNWVEVVLNPDIQDIPYYMEMECLNDDGTTTSRALMVYADYFTGRQTRFWIYGVGGSVAKTEWQAFAHEADFTMDLF